MQVKQNVDKKLKTLTSVQQQPSTNNSKLIGRISYVSISYITHFDFVESK